MPKVARHKVIEAALQTNGNITLMAESLGLSRRTIYNYEAGDSAIAEAIAEARENFLDRCEAELEAAIFEDKDRSLLRFVLRTRGRGRGYAERVQVDGTVDKVIEAISRLTPDEFAALQARLTGANSSKPRVEPN